MVSPTIDKGSDMTAAGAGGTDIRLGSAGDQIACTCWVRTSRAPVSLGLAPELLSGDPTGVPPLEMTARATGCCKTLRRLAAALTFAGVLRFAGVLIGLAASLAFALVLPLATVLCACGGHGCRRRGAICRFVVLFAS